MRQEVRGVVAREKGAPVTLETIVVPDPGPGEAVVAIKASGVCHTDLHYREGGINDDVRDMITSDASVDDIRNFARSQGMTTLREAGLKLIFDGVSTIDEVVRETVMEDVE